jgi:polyhydroxybutyrate depolymerase
MSFMHALVARMMFDHAIDQKLVYVFGYSNGGHMAFRLAMEAPAEIAAIASVAACLPTRPKLRRACSGDEHRPS